MPIRQRTWVLTRPLRSRSYSTRPFKFNIGLSFAGKPELPSEKVSSPGFPKGSPIAVWRDEMLSWKKVVPAKSAGHDFFYVQEMRNKSGVSIGVADGVGAWIDSGVDPSLFAQALMYHAHRYAKNAWAGEPETDPTQEEQEPVEGWELPPLECLEAAYNAVLREKAVRCGSSTACIINLNASSGLLRAANLGDSGFLIIRSSSLLHVQPTQTHFFNCPLQLSKLPVQQRSGDVDLPRDADVFSTSLRNGDIVVAYTDGLSDNVFPAEILGIASLTMRSDASDEQKAQDIADRLVHFGRQAMASTKVSPFQREAAKEGLYHRGGKVDDVSVVVAVVSEEI